MGYVFFNPNPAKKRIGDCVIRGISIAENKSWEDIFIELMLESFMEHDLPTANHVWAKYLRGKGYARYPIPNTCPDCYTVRDFANDNKDWCYILATGSHVVTVLNGDYYDTWDSGDEVPIYYFVKER